MVRLVHLFAFGLYFAPVFFPTATTPQLLNTRAIFAVGFVMRPIGAWLMASIARSRAQGG
jgi:MHS family alpha-ketoglutarate permease-like MFS transporter